MESFQRKRERLIFGIRPEQMKVNEEEAVIEHRLQTILRPLAPLQKKKSHYINTMQAMNEEVNTVPTE